MKKENHIPTVTPDEDGIFRGDAAREMLKFLLQDIDNGPMYSCLRTDMWRVKGYYKDIEPQTWVAFDNQSHECFVEQFSSEAVAYDWVCGNFDVV